MSALSLVSSAAVMGAALLLPFILHVWRFGSSGSRSASHAAAFDSAESIITQHTFVAVAVWPIAVGVAWLLAYFATELATSARDFGSSGVLPERLASLATRVGVVGVDVTFFDVQALACLLYVAYGLVLIERRLVDIVRLLKLSLRRLLKPDAALEARMDRVNRQVQGEAAIKLASSGSGAKSDRVRAR